MFLFTCMDVYLCGFMHVSTVSDEGTEFPEAGVTGDCLVPQRGFWELHLGPLLEQQALLGPQGETSYPPSPTRKSSMQRFI